MNGRRELFGENTFNSSNSSDLNLRSLQFSNKADHKFYSRQAGNGWEDCKYLT